MASSAIEDCSPKHCTLTESAGSNLCHRELTSLKLLLDKFDQHGWLPTSPPRRIRPGLRMSDRFTMISATMLARG